MTELKQVGLLFCFCFLLLHGKEEIIFTIRKISKMEKEDDLLKNER